MRQQAATRALDWIDEAIADLPPILTVKEACSVLRTCNRNLRRMISAGRLHAVRPVESGSSRLLIPRASVERYLRSLDGDGAGSPA